MKIIGTVELDGKDTDIMSIIPLSISLFSAALAMILLPPSPLRLLGWGLLILPLPWLPLGAWMAQKARLSFTPFLTFSTFLGFAFSPFMMALSHVLSSGGTFYALMSLLCHIVLFILLKKPKCPRPQFSSKTLFPVGAAIFILLFTSYITLPLWGAGQANPGANILKPLVEPNPYRTFTKLFVEDYLGRVATISEVSKGPLPPRFCFLAAERWPFHWFWFLIAADLSVLGGVSFFFINKMLPTTGIVLFLATVYYVCRYFEKKYLFTAGVLLFATFLSSYEHFGLLLKDPHPEISWTSFFLSPEMVEEGLTDSYNSLIHNYIFSNHSFISASLFLWSLVFLANSSRSVKIITGLMVGTGIMFQPFFCICALMLLGSLFLFHSTSRPKKKWLQAALITSPAVLIDLRLAPIPLLLLFFGLFRPSFRRSKELLWILMPAGLTAILMLKVLIGPIPAHGGSQIFLEPGLLLLKEARYDLSAVAEIGQWEILIAFNILLCLYLLPVMLCSWLRCGSKGLVISIAVATIAAILLNASPLFSLSKGMPHIPGLMRLSHNFLAVFVSLLEMGIPLLFVPWIAFDEKRKPSLLFEVALMGSIVLYILMNAISIHNVHNDFLYKFSTFHRLLLSFLGAYGFSCFVSSIKRQSRALKTLALIWASMAILLVLPFTFKFFLWNLDTSTQPTIRITDEEADMIAWIKNNTPENAVVQGIPLKPREYLGIVAPFMHRSTGFVDIGEVAFVKGPEVAKHYKEAFGDAIDARTPSEFYKKFKVLGIDYICVFDYADEAVRTKIRSFVQGNESIQKVYSNEAGEVYRIQPEL